MQTEALVYWISWKKKEKGKWSKEWNQSERNPECNGLSEAGNIVPRI